MPGLLYYLPGLKAAGAAELEAAGLATVFGGASFGVATVTNNGPDGGLGVIVFRDSARPVKLGFHAEGQEWVEVSKFKVPELSSEFKVQGSQPGTRNPELNSGTRNQELSSGTRNPGFWLGREKDNPVTPEDLARDEMIAGHEVTLADGREWSVPLLRDFPAGFTLGSVYTGVGPNGELVKETLPKYQTLRKKTERVWNTLRIELGWVEGDGEIPPQEMFDLAAEYLGLNYHVGAAEILFLRLLGRDAVVKVLGAAVDLPTLLAVSKMPAVQERKKAASAAPAGAD